jgi:hypothetical protein
MATKSRFSAPESFSDLLDVSDRENWCTKPVCTTCGAVPFRSALRSLSREAVIAGLRTLSIDYLHDRGDMFHLIVAEISRAGGRDLLAPLDGSDAAVFLHSEIAAWERRCRERSARLASLSPEAVAARRAEKAAVRDAALRARMERKAVRETALVGPIGIARTLHAGAIVRWAARELSEAQRQAIAGVVYRRLAAFYLDNPISSADMLDLTALAEKAGGHWAKLLRRIPVSRV